MEIGNKVKYIGSINAPLHGEVGTILEIDHDHHGMGEFYNIAFNSETTWIGSRNVQAYKEDVTSPSHYHRGGIDVIEFAKQNYSFDEVKGFFRINILKYTHRYDKKNNVEDLIKANDYLARLKEWEEEHERD